MNNPAFLVDGQMEKLIIEKLCPNQRVRLTGLNGKDVTIEAIAKKASALIRLLNGKNYPIVVLIDREDRPESAEEIANLLKTEMRNEGIKDDLIIGVADRMIENWILADWSSLQLIWGFQKISHHKQKEIRERLQ